MLQKEYERFLQGNKKFSALKRFNRLYDLSLDSSKRFSNTPGIKERINSFMDSIKSFSTDDDARITKYIANHGDSYLSAYFLRLKLYRFNLDSARLLYAKLEKNIKNSFYGRKIEEDLRTIEGGGPGSKARDFTAVDIAGDTLTLSSFANKNVVLLDFWATWCKPCRQNAPFLTQLYRKFHDKGLEIISIANDDTRVDLWKSVVKEDGMSWRNILQGAGSKNDIGKLYAIQPIPAYILINKTGQIMLRFEGEQNKMLEGVLSMILK
jgi:thiol-disulfide isomerase/thioredoxin